MESIPTAIMVTTDGYNQDQEYNGIKRNIYFIENLVLKPAPRRNHYQHCRLSVKNSKTHN